MASNVNGGNAQWKTPVEQQNTNEKEEKQAKIYGSKAILVSLADLFEIGIDFMAER